MAVDLGSTIPVQFMGVTVQIPIPAQHVTKVGTWTGVNDDTTRLPSELAPEGRKAFWNLLGNLQLIPDPDKVIFLVGLIENDDANPESVRVAVEAFMMGNLVSNLTLTRDQLVATLIESMNGAIYGARAAGVTFPFNTDDPIGTVQELRIYPVDLEYAYRNGSISTNSLRFYGDDALYEITFQISTT